MDRRTFFGLILKGGGTVAAGIVGIPALLTAFSPVLNRRSSGTWQPLGPLDTFPVGGVQKAIVEIPRADWAEALRTQGVFVWRPSEAEVVVFSRSCTDLSCPINYDPGSGWFFCPCHGGIFAEDGKPVAGPPKRPLFRYANRVRGDGVLEIDLDSLPPMT